MTVPARLHLGLFMVLLVITFLLVRFGGGRWSIMLLPVVLLTGGLGLDWLVTGWRRYIRRRREVTEREPTKPS